MPAVGQPSDPIEARAGAASTTGGESMVNPAVNLNDVGHAIQLALAPVFLLTGIAGILNVMAGRWSLRARRWLW